ncbi:MAG: DUF4476 domain-containing protein [Bacteroidota bacterium]
MKKLILLSATLLLFGSSRANYYYKSELHLSLFDQSTFNVVLDGNFFSDNTTTYSINNLTPGKHFLKVYKYAPSHYSWSNPVAITVFAGFIQIPSSAKVYAMIDNLYTFKVYEQTPIYGEIYEYMNTYEEPYYSMPSFAFQSLKSTVAAASFDATKLKISQQAISANKVMASQVAELMAMMTFEATKLDLAKYAFRYTLDKENYFMVNRAFTFESSIEELDEYLALH